MTELKNRVDASADRFDLQQLVFRDLEDPTLKAQVLSHIRSEAGPKTGALKVLSDIDDTFYANWVDDRFPKKTVYPGVRAFYEELDKGGGAAADRVGDLMFLSARPYDSAGTFENKTRKMLNDNGVAQATVLSGDLLHLIGNDRIAQKKFDNWEEVRQLYPEYGSVFIGDSGQGDAIFGARGVATADGLKASYIHNVTHLDDAARSDFAEKGVHLFDTYVGAATQAFQQGLIGKPGLMRVISETLRDFEGTTFASPEQKAARRHELDRDLASARAAL